MVNKAEIDIILQKYPDAFISRATKNKKRYVEETYAIQNILKKVRKNSKV